VGYDRNRDKTVKDFGRERSKDVQPPHEKSTGASEIINYAADFGATSITHIKIKLTEYIVAPESPPLFKCGFKFQVSAVYISSHGGRSSRSQALGS
jgi:hypothetical protein